MHNVCLQLIGLRSTDGRQQNMPTCFEVSTIIVGDFSNENIHHLCYNIGTKISKTILHKSLQHYLCNARATFQLYQSLNFKLLLQLQLLFLHPSTPPTSITVVSPPSTPPTTIAIIAPINPSESSIAVTSSATATVLGDKQWGGQIEEAWFLSLVQLGKGKTLFSMLPRILQFIDITCLFMENLVQIPLPHLL